MTPRSSLPNPTTNKLMIVVSLRIDLISHPQHAVTTCPAVYTKQHDSKGRFHYTGLRAPSPKIPPFGRQPLQPTFPFLLCSDRTQQALEAVVIFGTYQGFQNPHLCNRFLCLSSRPTPYISRPRRGMRSWTSVIVSHCSICSRTVDFGWLMQGFLPVL